MIDLGEFRRVGPAGQLDGVRIEDAKRDPDCPRFFRIGDASYVHATEWVGFLTDKLTCAQPGDMDVATFVNGRALLRRLSATLTPLVAEPSAPTASRRRARTPEPATAG